MSARQQIMSEYFHPARPLYHRVISPGPGTWADRRAGFLPCGRLVGVSGRSHDKQTHYGEMAPSAAR